MPTPPNMFLARIRVVLRLSWSRTNARKVGLTGTCVAPSSSLVGRRSVDRWKRHVVETQIDGELAAMVDQVIDVRAHHGAARRREEHAIAVFEGPRDREVCVP